MYMVAVVGAALSVLPVRQPLTRVMRKQGEQFVILNIVKWGLAGACGSSTRDRVSACFAAAGVEEPLTVSLPRLKVDPLDSRALTRQPPPIPRNPRRSRTATSDPV